MFFGRHQDRKERAVAMERSRCGHEVVPVRSWPDHRQIGTGMMAFGTIAFLYSYMVQMLDLNHPRNGA